MWVNAAICQPWVSHARQPETNFALARKCSVKSILQVVRSEHQVLDPVYFITLALIMLQRRSITEVVVVSIYMRAATS